MTYTWWLLQYMRAECILLYSINSIVRQCVPIPAGLELCFTLHTSLLMTASGRDRQMIVGLVVHQQWPLQIYSYCHVVWLPGFCMISRITIWLSLSRVAALCFRAC